MEPEVITISDSDSPPPAGKRRSWSPPADEPAARRRRASLQDTFPATKPKLAPVPAAGAAAPRQPLAALPNGANGSAAAALQSGTTTRPAAPAASSAFRGVPQAPAPPARAAGAAGAGASAAQGLSGLSIGTGTTSDAQLYDDYIETLFAEGRVHSIPGFPDIKFIDQEHLLEDPRFDPGVLTTCHALAEEIKRVRALPASRRPYDLLPRFQTWRELEAYLARRVFVCNQLTVSQPAVDRLVDEMVFRKHKVRLGAAPFDLMAAPSPETVSVYSVGAVLLDAVLPAGTTEGDIKVFITTETPGHYDRQQASDRDDAERVAGRPTATAWMDQPRVRPIHNVGTGWRIMELSVPDWLAEHSNPAVAAPMPGGYRRCLLPRTDPRALRVQMLLPPQGLTFPCWEVSTQLLHKVLGNGGRGHLNVLHERHLPYGREHGWHGERVVAHATQQLRRL